MTGKEWYAMKGRNNTWTDMAAAAAFAAVLGISAFWGQHDRAYDQAGTAGSAYGRMYNQAGPADEDGGPAGKAGAYPGTAGAAQAAERAGEDLARTGGEDKEILPDVTESQKAVLDKIIKALEAQDLETAAQVMDSGEEELVTLFYEVMDGARYLYDGRSFSQSMEGEGLVLTMPKTLYYGTFKGGRPEGECTALQVVELDAPRYDYSQGLWKDGKMEGLGHTGYCYYETSPEGEARDVCKTGRFSGDRLEGEVTYTTLNQEGETSTWMLEVKDGTVQLDDRWIYIEERGEYQLMSQEDDSHAYIMDEQLADQPVWINLLAWEE